MLTFRLLLGVEDIVYVTLLFSLLSYSRLWWNFIVMNIVSSTPSKSLSLVKLMGALHYSCDVKNFASGLMFMIQGTEAAGEVAWVSAGMDVKNFTTRYGFG